MCNMSNDDDNEGARARVTGALINCMHDTKIKHITNIALFALCIRAIRTPRPIPIPLFATFPRIPPQCVRS